MAVRASAAAEAAAALGVWRWTVRCRRVPARICRTGTPGHSPGGGGVHGVGRTPVAVASGGRVPPAGGGAGGSGAVAGACLRLGERAGAAAVLCGHQLASVNTCQCIILRGFAPIHGAGGAAQRGRAVERNDCIRRADADRHRPVRHREHAAGSRQRVPRAGAGTAGASRTKNTGDRQGPLQWWRGYLRRTRRRRRRWRGCTAWAARCASRCCPSGQWAPRRGCCWRRGATT